MAGALGDAISSVNFYEVHRYLDVNGFFDYIFPFLLVYALFFTSLKYASIFKNKNGVPNKSIIVTVALILTFFGVSFEVSPGKTVGFLMQALFPNISALTIGILMLYIIGGMLNVDFFKGTFRKDYGGFVYFFILAIALGAVVFYLGITFGAWSYSIFDQLAYWNTVFAVGFLILGIVLSLTKLPQFGVIFILIAGLYISGPDDISIFRYFVDPFVFMLLVFVLFYTWTKGTDNEEKIYLARKLNDGNDSIQDFIKSYNGKPKDYESRVYDIIEQGFQDNLKKWKERYGNEDYHKYKGE